MFNDYNLLEKLSKQSVLGIDTESEGLFDFSNKLLTVQIGNYDEQCIIDWITCDDKTKKLVKTIIENPKILKIGQNLKYDYKVFFREGIVLENIYDTMIVELLFNAGLKKEKGYYGLGSIIERYTGVVVSKELQSNIGDNIYTEEGIEYMKNDVKYLEMIREKQLVKVRELEIEPLCQLEFDCVCALGYTEYCGIKYDSKRADKVQEEFEEKRDSFKDYLDAIAPINWRSYKQKLEVLSLYDKTITSSAKEELNKRKHIHPIFEALLDYNKYNALISKYLKSMPKHINEHTGRIHTSIWQILVTGRMASKEPNIMNIPSQGEGPKIRACFVPEKGNVFVGGDYSGAELRIIAHFSGSPVWKEILDRPDGNLHSELCAMTFGIPISDVKKPFPIKPDLTYRDVQKKVNFSLAYGATAAKLAKELECSKQEAQAIIDKFFGLVPKVKEFLEYLSYIGQSTGRICTHPYKRYRYFDSSPESPTHIMWKIGRESKNHPIQGTCADIVKLALSRIYKYIKDNDFKIKIVNIVHDEIITECPIELSTAWKPLMQSIMVKSAEEIVDSLAMRCETNILEYWKK